MNENLYREHILDLYKNPINFGKIKDATHTRQGNSPLCGDEMTVYLKVKDGKIEDVKFDGHGCAISIASASIISDKIKGKEIIEVLKLKKEDVIKLLEIPISGSRTKCATLFLKTVVESLEDEIGNQKFEC